MALMLAQVLALGLVREQGLGQAWEPVLALAPAPVLALGLGLALAPAGSIFGISQKR